MFLFLFSLAIVGQVDRVELNDLAFRVHATHSVQIKRNELPKTKKSNKRVYFDIKPAKLGPKLSNQISAKNSQIKSVRIAQFSKDTIRVVAKVLGTPKLSMSQVIPSKKISSKNISYPKIPDRVFADKKPAVKTPTKALVKKVEVEETGLRIVIDAGHGGDDPGAIGKRGLREKDVTLALSKKVKKLIEKRVRNSKVFLTRDRDKTLALSDRTKFANKMKADLFISIHVNASPNSRARGIETYYLNTSHDRYALRLAARENAMSEDETSQLEFILADLAMKSSVSESVRLGRLVQKNVHRKIDQRWSGVRDLGLKSALFYVLMGAKMPAILVETSFISNKLDERRLKSDSYQADLAEGIVKGVQKYSEEKLALR